MRYTRGNSSAKASYKIMFAFSKRSNCKLNVAVQPPRQELPNFKSLNKMLKPQRMVPSKPAPFKVDPSRFFNVVSPPTTKKVCTCNN